MAYFNGEDYFEDGIRIYLWFAEKSIGKTTWGFKYGLKQYEKYGTSFAWMFNNEKEVNAFKSIELKSLIDLNRYKIKGNTVIDKEADGEVIVCVLGNAKFPHYLKNYQNITTLFYDEFTRSTGLSHFQTFTNFITAVSNLERKKKNFRIFAFSNTLSMDNAFFTNLDIVLPQYDSKEHMILYKREMSMKFMILKQGEFFEDKDKKDSLANQLAGANEKISSSLFGNQFNLDNIAMIKNVKREELFKDIKKFMYRIRYIDHTLVLFSLKDGSWMIDYYGRWDQNIILKLPTINFTILDLFMDNRRREELENNNDIFESMEIKIGAEQLFFGTIEIRNIVLNFLASMKLLRNDWKRK